MFCSVRYNIIPGHFGFVRYYMLLINTWMYADWRTGCVCIWVCVCISWLWIIKMLCIIQFLVVLSCKRLSNNIKFPLGWIKYYAIVVHLVLTYMNLCVAVLHTVRLWGPCYVRNAGTEKVNYCSSSLLTSRPSLIAASVKSLRSSSKCAFSS